MKDKSTMKTLEELFKNHPCNGPNGCEDKQYDEANDNCNKCVGGHAHCTGADKA